MVHNLNGDAQATAGEATVQHVEGEPMEMAVTASWWHAVQQYVAAGGFFSQCGADPAEMVGIAEGHGAGLGDGSIQREEAKRLKILKTRFKFQLGLV